MKSHHFKPNRVLLGVTRTMSGPCRVPCHPNGSPVARGSVPSHCGDMEGATFILGLNEVLRGGGGADAVFGGMLG